MEDTKYTVTFTNGALQELKDVAEYFGIARDSNDIGDVLIKGLKLISLSKDGKIFIEKDKERLEVDPKKL